MNLEKNTLSCLGHAEVVHWTAQRPDDIRPGCAFPCTIINSDSGEYAESRVVWRTDGGDRTANVRCLFKYPSAGGGPSNRIGRPPTHSPAPFLTAAEEKITFPFSPNH